MKYTKTLLIIWLLLSSYIGLAQHITFEYLPTKDTIISIYDDKSQIRFNEKNGNKVILQFIDTLQIESIKTKNKKHNYGSDIGFTDKSGFKEYDLSVVPIDGYAFVFITANEKKIELRLGPAPASSDQPNTASKGAGDYHNSPCNSCTDIKGFEDDLIHYDFKCKTFYKTFGTEKHMLNIGNLSFPNNSQFRLKIENINRYLYDVNVEGTNVNYGSEVPELLNKFLIGDTSLMTKLSQKFAQSGELKVYATGEESIEDNIGSLLSDLEDLKLKLIDLEVEKLSAYDICNSFLCCESQEKINLRKTTAKDYASIAKELVSIKHKIPTIQLAINNADEIKKRESN